MKVTMKVNWFMILSFGSLLLGAGAWVLFDEWRYAFGGLIGCLFVAVIAASISTVDKR